MGDNINYEFIGMLMTPKVLPLVGTSGPGVPCMRPAIVNKHNAPPTARQLSLFFPCSVMHSGGIPLLRPAATPSSTVLPLPVWPS